MVTFQLKTFAYINGVKEFIWSISTDEHRGTTLRLNSGKVHKVLPTDVITFD